MTCTREVYCTQALWSSILWPIGNRKSSPIKLIAYRSMLVKLWIIFLRNFYFWVFLIWWCRMHVFFWKWVWILFVENEDEYWHREVKFRRVHKKGYKVGIESVCALDKFFFWVLYYGKDCSFTGESMPIIICLHHNTDHTIKNVLLLNCNRM